jgi:uroporphyrinogen III methyltransferase/synthase
LRARERLAEADLVLYDYLVNPRILAYARRGAELVCLGRHGHGRMVSQDEVHRRMVDAAKSGQVVARLKGGDPAIFARTAEETAALQAAGVPYEIVPGITAAQAASSYAGIPLTCREAASCVALITGRHARDEEPSPLDMAALAQFPGTLVFYMGVTTAGAWSGALVAAGKPPETPVAIVRHASLPQQQTFVTTLGELPDAIARHRVRPPAVFIVGEAVAARATFDWFASRPLFGRTVLVTRAAHQADALVDRLAELGAAVVVQPAIEIRPPASAAAADAAIDRLRDFDWIVFSSANGVQHFFDRLASQGLDLRAVGHAKLAAIGPGTAAALAAYRLQADLQPEEFRAEALADALAAVARGKRALLVRASRGREALAESMAAAGVEVAQAVFYESRDVDAVDPEVATALAEGRIDWITVTSSAIARAIVRQFGAELQRARLAAISPITAEVLATSGFNSAAIAARYTMEGLVEAIVAAERGGQARA